ncbi:MAG TPA: undecaprenyl-diphosphate phosphatase [Thermofilum sp.]|nr:undecaprenyl-diphosphate phosphatase [Thermofilum sp.]
MNILHSLIIGVLQGLLEWIPVSSSGQLTLFIVNLLSLNVKEAYLYSLAVHMGSLIALLVKFRDEIVNILLNTLRLNPGSEEKFLIISTAITGVVGMPIYIFLTDVIKGGAFINGLIGFSLLVTGFLIKKAGKGLNTLKEVTIFHAVMAGIAQGFSAIPGISRSGITVSILLLMGIEQGRALRLSFLMGIPALMGASLMALLNLTLSYQVLISLILSFMVSMLSIDFLLKLASWLSFYKFCILFGLLTLLSLLIS